MRTCYCATPAVGVVLRRSVRALYRPCALALYESCGVVSRHLSVPDAPRPLMVEAGSQRCGCVNGLTSPYGSGTIPIA